MSGGEASIPYIGTAIRDECALDDDIRAIADVPSRSLLSRLTDHYLQIIANRAPIGFEAEFANPRGETICYRGILMPFSSDGDTIDFIYGVINWKNVGASAAVEPFATDFANPASDEAVVLEQDRFGNQPVDPEPVDAFADSVPELAEITLDEDAGLADRLWAARETAETVKVGEGRTRAALYHALSLAYDFAIAARREPADYAELLEESGVKAQARAPMTPIVKLVFGIDYDKARLIEFAAALSFADRREIAPGGFQQLIEQQPGGLKALVAAERQERRPAGRSDGGGDAARAKLRSAPPITLADIARNDEFLLVITRRRSDGLYEPVALVEDEALVERAIRKAA